MKKYGPNGGSNNKFEMHIKRKGDTLCQLGYGEDEKARYKNDTSNIQG